MTIQEEKGIYPITDEEVSTAANILKKLEPGYLPLDIFNQIFRLAFTVACEVIPIRIVNGQIEVLFIKRPDDDTNWPGMWHTPGCVFRPTDTSIEMPLNRVLENELSDCKYNEQPVMVGNMISNGDLRHGLLFLHILQLEDNGNIGQFFPLDKFPESRIKHQDEFISFALSEYSRHQEGIIGYSVKI